jgi:hypothetical protein
MSQDPVALESVGADIMCNEPNLTTGNNSFTADLDNSFREMALAHNPPSGVKYYPYNDGNAIAQSLGVHEHWNNTTEKKYSRNLSAAGTGIELIMTDSRPPVTAIQSPALSAQKTASSRIESVRFVSGTIVVGYTLYEAGSVGLDILDVRGRIVATAPEENQSVGYHSAVMALNPPVKAQGAQCFVVRLKTNNGCITRTVSGL